MKIRVTCMSMCLLATTFGVNAEPFGRSGGPEAEPPPHPPRVIRPAPFDVLPPAAEMVIISGLTYYMLNGIYYQKRGDHYLSVEPPDRGHSGDVRSVLDYKGKRYYLQDGHYYQRDINGDYLEVPRPSGLE